MFDVLLQMDRKGQLSNLRFHKMYTNVSLGKRNKCTCTVHLVSIWSDIFIYMYISTGIYIYICTVEIGLLKVIIITFFL